MDVRNFCSALADTPRSVADVCRFHCRERLQKQPLLLEHVCVDFSARFK